MQLKKFLEKRFLTLSRAHWTLKFAQAENRFCFQPNNVRPPQTILAPNDAENLLGDFQSLADQIGSADGLALAGAVNASLRLDHVTDLAGLKNFLESYRTQLLIPVELPLICRAYAHASKNEFSELLALDQQLARESRVDLFASASKRIGLIQIKRLRPLRDQRGLQRYLRAVDSGEAHAWHTLVYGITLASFSLPLRQGLLNYAEQVLKGFIHSPGRLPREECQNLLEQNVASIPPLLDGLLTNCQFVPRIQIA